MGTWNSEGGAGGKEKYYYGKYIMLNAISVEGRHH
jgi:hypothetical protein